MKREVKRWVIASGAPNAFNSLPLAATMIGHASVPPSLVRFGVKATETHLYPFRFGSKPGRRAGARHGQMPQLEVRFEVSYLTQPSHQYYLNIVTIAPTELQKPCS